MSDIDSILRQIKPRVSSWIAHDLTAISSTQTNDHGLLIGLSDDDHLQYVHTITARSISAQHTFAPASSAAPFILGINAQSQLVTGFYADHVNKSVTAGTGLAGGGSLASGSGVTLSLPTPGTLSVSTTNSATAPHTHEITAYSHPDATSQILKSDSNGYLEVIRLNTDTISNLHGTNITLVPSGDITVDPGGNNILPYANYDINVGSISKKYLAIWASELWVETLVAQDAIATIGGHILVAPTTVLVEDCAAGDTHFHVKHNQMVSGDRVYLNSYGKIEWIAITSGASGGAGNYSYNITRNLDGTGSNDWFGGDAVLNTGTTGNGYLDIYSLSSIRSGTHYGPTIVGNVRTGTTYSDLIEHWAIGNLHGLYGYGADYYGAAFGRFADGYSFVTVDNAEGFRIWKRASSASTMVSQWDLDGSILIGQQAVSQDNVYISVAGGLQIRTNTTVHIDLQIDGDVFIGTDTSAAATTNLIVWTSSGNTWNGEASWDSGDMLFGYNQSGYANIKWDKSAGTFSFRGGVTTQVVIDTAGKVVAGAGDVWLDVDGMSINVLADEYARNSIKFMSTTTKVASLLAYNNGTARLNLTLYGWTGDDSILTVRSVAPATLIAQTSLVAQSSTGYTTLTVYSDSDMAGANGYVRITSSAAGDGSLRVQDGLYVGGNVDPGTGNISLTGVLTIGGDTDLYRYAAHQLATDDNFSIGAGLYVGAAGGAVASGNIILTGGLYFGSGADTNLYRGAANQLMTDDAFRAVGRVDFDGLLVIQGDFHMATAMHRYPNGVDTTCYAFVPLATPLISTSWDGNESHSSDGSLQLMDLSAVFGAPAAIKAVLLQLTHCDSGANTTDCLIQFYNNGTGNGQGPGVRCMPATDRWFGGQLIVTCDANGDIYRRIYASGTNTYEIFLSILGYWV